VTSEERAVATATLDAIENFAETKFANVPIDSVCLWPLNPTVRCQQLLTRVLVVHEQNTLWVVAYCQHHSECMAELIHERREAQKRLSHDEIDRLYEEHKR